MRAALVALGGLVIGYAVLGAATDPGLKPGGVVLFLAAVLVAHDAVLLPATIAVGALIARFAPGWARPSIRTAAIVSLAVGLVALPLVLGYGRSADNPSILPLAYGRGLTFILIMVWVVALVAALVSWRSRATSTGRDRPKDSAADDAAGDQPDAGTSADQQQRAAGA